MGVSHMNASRSLTTHSGRTQCARWPVSGYTRKVVLGIVAARHSCSSRGKRAEARRTQKRRELYEAQDAIDARRDELIENIERQLEQSDRLESLFTVRWSVV